MDHLIIYRLDEFYGKPIRNRPRDMFKESMGCLGPKQSNQGFLVVNPNSLHVYKGPLCPKNVNKSSIRVSSRFWCLPFFSSSSKLHMVFVTPLEVLHLWYLLSRAKEIQGTSCYCYITTKGMYSSFIYEFRKLQQHARFLFVFIKLYN